MSLHLDKIIYINLDKRTDRKEQIESELDKFGLKYDRFCAIECEKFGIYGCGLSHLAVLKKAKEQNYKNILILEDDFEFLITKELFEEQLNKFFESNINFDVCMISYNLKETQEFENDIVGKIQFAQTASGYIVNNHYYDKLIKLYEWALPLLIQTEQHWIYANDIVWRNYQRNDNWFYFKIRIGKQRISYSDNAKSVTDYGV